MKVYQHRGVPSHRIPVYVPKDLHDEMMDLKHPEESRNIFIVSAIRSAVCDRRDAFRELGERFVTKPFIDGHSTGLHLIPFSEYKKGYEDIQKECDSCIHSLYKEQE